MPAPTMQSPVATTFSDQAGASRHPAWQPPPVSHQPPAPPRQPETAVAAEIQQIRRQLGGSGVAHILGDNELMDGATAEAVFNQTIDRLQQQTPAGQQTAPATTAPTDALLSAQEAKMVQQHLHQFADQLQQRQPGKAAAFRRLAVGLQVTQKTGSQKR